LAPVELLDRAVQSDHALLDQVAELQAVALVALGDRDHEAQVGVDHPLLRGDIATLDALRERDLLRRRQQRIAAGLVHEEREAVGGAAHRSRGAGHRLGMWCRDHLDAALLELGAGGGDLPLLHPLLGRLRLEDLLLQLVLVRVRLEDLLLELSELLRLVDEGAGFQFSKLGQFSSLLLPSLQRTGAWAAPTPSKTLSGGPVFLTTAGLAWISDGSGSFS